MKLEDITFLIVTYKSEKIIRKCLSDLPEVSKKIIIENSGNVKLKEELLREFKNLKVRKVKIPRKMQRNDDVIIQCKSFIILNILNNS